VTDGCNVQTEAMKLTVFRTAHNGHVGMDNAFVKSIDVMVSSDVMTEVIENIATVMRIQNGHVEMDYVSRTT